MSVSSLKKTLARTAATLALAIAALGAAQAASVSVNVNGQPLTLDQAPLITGSRVLVPLRGIFERLGATVVYDAGSRSVRATQGSSSILLPIGASQATVDNRPVTLDVPAQVVGGRTLVPLRFVAEALGAHVTWNAESRTVAIQGGMATVPPSTAYSPPVPPPPPVPPEPPVAPPPPPVAPQSATLPLPSGAATSPYVIITAPLKGQSIQHAFVVMGRSLPGATVEVRGIVQRRHWLGLITSEGQQVVGRAQADADGNFSVPLDVGSVPRGGWVEIQARAFANGVVSKPVKYDISVSE